MKSFNEYHDQLDEGFLRGASAAVLMKHIHTQRRLIQKHRKVDHQTLDALASMILASASLTFAMTQFSAEKKEK